MSLSQLVYEKERGEEYVAPWCDVVVDTSDLCIVSDHKQRSVSKEKTPGDCSGRSVASYC